MLLFLFVDAMLSLRVAVGDEFRVAGGGCRFDLTVLQVGEQVGQSLGVVFRERVVVDFDDFDCAVAVCAAEPVVSFLTLMGVTV